MTGLEVELNLVDDAGDPALKNAEVLEAIADPAFQTELGQFNIEINVPPALAPRGRPRRRSRTACARSLNDAEAKAAEVGAHQVMIGILPTLAAGPPERRRRISANPRYRLLERADPRTRAARTSAIDITGAGAADHDRRLDPARGGLHQHPVPRADLARSSSRRTGTPPRRSRRSSSRSAPTRRTCLGKELWRETRIPLFEQATDTRSEELKAQGVRPRVWFGERWITSVFDLFEENVRYFPALLPITDDEDPLAVLEDGGTPAARRAAAAQRHDLPLEPAGLRHRRRRARTCASRTACSPAGPTVVDTDRQRGVLLRAGPRTSPRATGRCGRRCRSRPRRRTSTSAAAGRHRRQRLLARRRRGDGHRAGAAPAAADGPRGPRVAGGSSADERDRLLGIIEQRCLLGVNGASWFVDRMHRRSDEDRYDALRATLLEYRERMHSNEPVHTWD